ncbi:MAG TPA: SDR family oxidoreductase [Flavobacteriales bacterium]|nr:SDR family oxidoreductase [Flavobacteriales bacterium]
MVNGMNGEHALVCGSTQGIGRATAIALAKEGATITLLARDRSALENTLHELDTNGGQQHGLIAVDMSDTAALADAVRKWVEQRPISILVNNTGGPAPGPAHEATVEDFEAAFRLHLLSYQTLVRALVPGMKARRHGRIVNIISTSVKQPLPNLGVSNTIRGAVANWSKTLANELGPFNITVNNVLPGATSTERLAAIVRNKAAKSGISEEAAAGEMMNEIPLRRFARPEEIAAAVVFLTGPSGAYISGINLPVDGGRTACL